MIFGYRSCVRINCLAEGFQHYSSQLEQFIGHRLRLDCWYLQHHPYLNLRARWAVALIRIMMTQKTSDIPILVIAKEMKQKYRKLQVYVQGGISKMSIEELRLLCDDFQIQWSNTWSVDRMKDALYALPTTHTHV